MIQDDFKKKAAVFQTRQKARKSQTFSAEEQQRKMNYEVNVMGELSIDSLGNSIFIVYKSIKFCGSFFCMGCHSHVMLNSTGAIYISSILTKNNFSFDEQHFYRSTKLR